MSGISTHILDTARGEPARGVLVRLYYGDQELASATTNEDGRVAQLLPESATLSAGTYRLTFATGSKWPEAFYPEVSIAFRVKDAASHYHVPLLISPFGYTTYRGS